MAPALPDDWHEVEHPEHITEKYRAKNPTLFVREGADVGVHVRPASTSSPHDPERYRVGAFEGGQSGFEEERELGSFEDRQVAFERALEFATRFDEAYDRTDGVVSALEAAVDRVS